MGTSTVREDTAARHIAKHTNRNLLHRLSLERFHNALASMIANENPTNLLDFGCGEGFVVDALHARGVGLAGYEGVDIRVQAVAAAQSRWPGKPFICSDIFDRAYDDRRFDTVMAIEVLEHLIDPALVLERLLALTRYSLILSVPHEPWFQLANLIRGRDFIRLGNHPEHVQHWNPKTFAEFVSRYADVVRIERHFPFILLSARPFR